MTGWKWECDTLQWDGNVEINMNILLKIKDWSPSPKLRNKVIKIYNENRKGSISVMHWNLGSRFWERKRDEVQLLVDHQSPDFLFISEANLFSDTLSHLIEIDGYTMTRAKNMESLNYSRIILLSKVGLVYKVEWDRMDREISSIWIKIGNRGNRSLRIGGVYREHSLIRQPGPDNFSDRQSQERRWRKFVSQWVAAGNSGPCMIIGDTNLDLRKWEDPEAFQEKVVDMVKMEITTMKMNQVIQGPTRFWVDTQPSLIDQ